MGFPYTSGIPAANNNPSNDQNPMKENFDTIGQWVAVDHEGFNTTIGGTHKFVTFTSENSPGAQTDPTSILYTTAGTASVVADVRFRNQNAIYPISLVRAWGAFDNGALPPVTQSQNITSVTRSSTGVFDVVMPANVVTGTSYGILISMTSGGLSKPLMSSYTITSATTFTLRFYDPFGITQNRPTNPDSFTVSVLQK